MWKHLQMVWLVKLHCVGAYLITTFYNLLLCLYENDKVSTSLQYYVTIKMKNHSTAKYKRYVLCDFDHSRRLEAAKSYTNQTWSMHGDATWSMIINIIQNLKPNFDNNIYQKDVIRENIPLNPYKKQ